MGKQVSVINAALHANSDEHTDLQRYAINFRGSAHDRAIAIRDVVLSTSEVEQQKEVASEVRSLAQRSAEAAREIKSLIGDSVTKVELGTQLVNDAGATMDDIVTQVKNMSDLIHEIGASTQEQTDGIDRVNDAVSELDRSPPLGGAGAAVPVDGRGHGAVSRA